MGSLRAGTSTLLVSLLLQLLLLLSQAKKGLFCRNRECFEANFKYKLKADHLFAVNKIRNLSNPWTLPLDALTASISLRNDQPCVKLTISVNASDSAQRHTNVDFCKQIRILRTAQPISKAFLMAKLQQLNFAKLQQFISQRSLKWNVSYNCWIVEPEQYIDISLITIPNYGVNISKQVYVASSDDAPEFHFQHDEEKRSFNVSVSRTQDAYARLCYKNDICKDLEGSGKLLVKASESVSLPYEDLLPCLCIEVFYTYRNSRRKQKCPFKEHAERYAADLLRVSATAIKYHDNTMMALFKNPCGEKPHIHLCRLHNGICSTIPDADIEERHGRYSIVGIDCNPDLCFKFTLLNHTYIKCPHRDDRVWNVTVEAGLRHVLLQTFSSVPSASFSAAICTWDQRNGSCAIKLPVYNFSATRQTKEKQLSIPWPGLGRCIQVWRTDVHFASKHVICSWDYSHKRLGLVALVTLLVVFMVTLLLFLSCRRIWKIFTAPLWRRTILLVYSPDSAEYKNFICVFADFLQNILGCEVILDMWDMNTISQTGMIAWFYQKRELVSQRKGKVMIVWTARTKSMYQQWMNRNANNNTWKDPANLFGAAMSCLNRDLSTGQKHFKLKEYSIVYFEGLCEKKDIPKNLKRISKFRLFKDLYRLVSRLQDTTCLSPPCLIKAAAKYLIRKLMHSKKKQGLQDHIDICKQKLLEEGSLEKNKMVTIVL